MPDSPLADSSYPPRLTKLPIVAIVGGAWLLCSCTSHPTAASDPNSGRAIYVNGVKLVQEDVKPPEQKVAPQALRSLAIKALAREGSPVNLDAKGWVLGSDLAWPEDGPLLWNGKVGIRFPTSPPVWRTDAQALQRAVMEWHSLAFTDDNDGFASTITPGPDPGWSSIAPNYFALDMRSGRLVGVDQNSVTEYWLDHDSTVHGRTIELDGSVPIKTIDAQIQPGPKAAPATAWPELAHGTPTNKATDNKAPVDWSTDIEIDGPPEDQLAVRSFLYYLRTSIPSQPPYQLSPMGRSSQVYRGHVFWDADIWLVPALAFIDPQPLMDGFAQYRSLRVQPKGPPFVWESATSGKETGPPAMESEFHVNGDVLWNLNFMAALGAKVPDLPKITKLVGKFYESRLTPRPGEAGTYDFKNVVSPDEGHTGDNDLYTNILAMWALKQAGISKSLYLPKDDQTFLTYEKDTLRGYKQAAAILAIYPLQYPAAEKQARAMLERFEDKVIPNGPAMSESINAVIWARLAEPDKAYDHWQQAWKPFVRGPLMLFSEKRNAIRTYFTTGAAGALQAVIYGFLGFRVDDRPMKDASWTKKLLNGKWLSITPHLPAAWRAVTFKNFAVLGKRYTLTVTREGGVQKVTVMQGVPNL